MLLNYGLYIFFKLYITIFFELSVWSQSHWPLTSLFSDECVVALSYSLFNNDPVTSVYPGLFVFTVIFVLVSLWLAIFLFLHFRQKITVKSNGYTKIADDPFTSATLSDSMQAEYCDKEGQEDDDEEEDEDIVYMGMDGVVYRKFKYSMLEGDEEGEEVALEYVDMYTLT